MKNQTIARTLYPYQSVPSATARSRSCRDPLYNALKVVLRNLAIIASVIFKSRSLFCALRFGINMYFKRHSLRVRQPHSRGAAVPSLLTKRNQTVCLGRRSACWIWCTLKPLLSWGGRRTLHTIIIIWYRGRCYRVQFFAEQNRLLTFVLLS